MGLRNPELSIRCSYTSRCDVGSLGKSQQGGQPVLDTLNAFTQKYKQLRETQCSQIFFENANQERLKYDLVYIKTYQ